MICAIVLLISIQFAFVNIFVSAFSGSVEVDEVAIFALKLLYVTIVRPTVLQKKKKRAFSNNSDLLFFVV